VQQDAWEIMRYYEHESGSKLADEFYDELMAAVRRMSTNPEGNHFDPSGLRRAALNRFPHHFLYRIRKADILILVLRHDRRHPSFGIKRR
jgi:plasmid stabilization system protein ParE